MNHPHSDDLGGQTQAQAQRLRAIIEGASAESISEDHAVRVTVGPQGALIDVDVTSRARGRGAEEIGAMLVAEIKKANRALNAELNAEIAEVLGVSGAAKLAPQLDASTLPGGDAARGDLAALRHERAAMRDEAREIDAPFGAPAALAKLDAIQEQVERLLEGFESFLGDGGDEENERAEALSDDGLVRVVLDDDGGIDRIELSDSATGNLTRVGRSVMQAAQRAQVAYSARIVEMVEKLGDADPFGLMSKARTQMPGEVGELLRQRADERRRGY